MPSLYRAIVMTLVKLYSSDNGSCKSIPYPMKYLRKKKNESYSAECNSQQ